jgi:triphosphoribosyl-dephospho-CoA synthase
VSLEQNHFYLSIKSIDDIIRCLTLASLLELAGWPKPGNVHRTKDFKDTRFEHFLAGIAAIQPNFRDLCERIAQIQFINDNDYALVELGSFYVKAAENMLKWQNGGNVLLGHILILAPLAATATICLKRQLSSLNDFKVCLRKIIDGSTVKDTEYLYKAIKLCNPGGLGKINKYDITEKDSIEQIIADKVRLKDIFELSKEYDLISSEYTSGFSIILDEGLQYYLNNFKTYKDINLATVNTFLFLLSTHPDTLIIRKSGIDLAKSVSKSAKQILNHRGISSEKGLNLTQKLDKELQKHEGSLNPGTTADLIAGIIFSALIFGLKY